jgi:two-component system, chemotaxis family, protein-glutamate methylesterase/glutaminase
MRKARVLVVDDAAVVRRIVSDVLVEDPQIDLVGVAANGKIALQKIPLVKPDVVTLDIEMPEMDGLETLRQLRKLHPKLPVIMFSTLTNRGAVATLDALSYGANDYVTKPANVGSVIAAMQSVRNELLPKIKAFCPWITASERPTAVATPKPTAAAKPRVPQRIDVVAIGVSTGGPNALATLFSQLPVLPVPIVIVQHMPPIFTRYLADRLASRSLIHAVEAKNGDLLTPGGAWIAPGDFHIELTKRENAISIRTTQGPAENSCRPAVDVLFRSVAEAYGPHTLAVIMTGMGQDGLLGCEHIWNAGGRILIQDEATSVVWGMPGAVARAELADQSVPLDELAAAIVQETCRGRVNDLPQRIAGEARSLATTST